MIITTTSSLNREIREYKGLVFGEVVSGADFFRDLGASIRNLIGGRSKGYEEEFCSAREDAIAEMTENAKKMGANAIIGVKIDYETIGGDSGSMMMVTASGTAVLI